MTNLREILPETAFKAKRRDKFQPKLEYNERCAILALVKAQVSRPLVSLVFDIDRRTIGHIVNSHSAHYKNVRAEFEKMGELDFAKKYVTEKVTQRVAEQAKTFRAVAREEVAAAPNAPSPRAAKKKGLHTVTPEQCAYSHRIDIQWMDEPEPGWYYRDLDTSTPDDWLHNGDESRKTSQACYTEAVANLTDD